MKSLTVLTAAAALVLAVSCGKKEPETPKEPTSTASPFVAKSSGQITPIQVKYWNAANVSLDSLAAASAESMNTTDSTQYRIAYVAYTESRDAICKNKGISGGFEEYEWIANNISKAINRPLLDSLDLKTL